MLKWIIALDRVLKGEATRPEALRGANIELPLGGLGVVILLLGVLYGTCMGVFSVLARWKSPQLYMGYQQLGASAVKVPLLFFLTLVVTMPSLYVFNALVGSKLSFIAVARLLVASLGVTMAVLASFGTIVVFFSLSTTSYSFMVVLNVVMFAVAGFLGLGFLLQTLHRLSAAQTEPPADEDLASPGPSTPPPIPTAGAAPHAPARTPGALEWLERRAVGRHVRMVFRIWVVVFGLVGGQMAWMLRPFIGNPTTPFTFLRPRESNFFEAVFDRAWDLATPSKGHSLPGWPGGR